MEGAYYRADVTTNISVLALNTLYWNVKDVTTDQGNAPQDQLAWLEQQFQTAEEGRKFFLTFHMYPGAKHTSHYHQLLFDSYNESYFKLLQKYADKVIMEIGAHDHIADIRYHDLDIRDVDFNTGNSSQKFLSKSNKEKKFFRNFYITASITPRDYNNPGVTILTVDDDTLVPQNLVTHYFQLHKNIEDPSLEEWLTLDYQKDFGFKDLSPEGIHEWKTSIEDNQNQTLKFLAAKVGYRDNESDFALQQIYD